jgi:hypothetical protein
MLNILKKFKKLFTTNLHPRYQLALDSNKYDIKSKSFNYLFKSYGDHTFITFTYQDIKNNKQILFSINPQDLITISINEHINTQKTTMLRISEILRDNKYLISDDDSHQIFDGEEICDNVLLLERINNLDLYKIAYSTGFKLGRSLTKSLTSQHKEMHNNPNNIVKLNIVEK